MKLLLKPLNSLNPWVSWLIKPIIKPIISHETQHKTHQRLPWNEAKFWDRQLVSLARQLHVQAPPSTGARSWWPWWSWWPWLWWLCTDYVQISDAWFSLTWFTMTTVGDECTIMDWTTCQIWLITWLTNMARGWSIVMVDVSLRPGGFCINHWPDHWWALTQDNQWA